ncbi:MAG: TonB-dependent receptor, partial [Pseudomonadota bacterium]
QFGFVPDRFDGNPNLVPETSTSWDVGIEQALFDGALVVDVTYFNANLENEIFGTFDFVTFRSSVANEDDESTREGIEVSLTAKPTPDVTIKGSYTYLRAREVRNNVSVVEVRRPKHSASLDVFAKFYDGRLRTNLGIVYNGKMEDLEFVAATPQTRVTLGDYVLGRLSAEYDITDGITWFGRMENLFNSNYQEVLFFETPGFAAYTGFRIDLGQLTGAVNGG